MPFVCGYFGTMVRNPELKETKTGKYITNFTIASNYFQRGEKKVDYLNCVAFGKTAETICKYLHKGSSFIAQTEYHNNPWRKCTLNGKEVDFPNPTFTVTSIILTERNKAENNNSDGQPGFYHESLNEPVNDNGFEAIKDEDDDLPF